MKFFSTIAIVLALALNVHAHASPVPMLGVSGIPTRNDVQNPSTGSPCGKINIAETINSSASVAMEADGRTAKINVTDYNAGADGSRSVSVLVDPTGTGKHFVAANVTKNGDPAPKTVGSDLVTVVLPAGTECSGGVDGASCLLSVKTTAGFGGCTLITQLESTSGSSTTTSSRTATTSAAAKAQASKAPCNSSKKTKRDRRAVGSRAARAARRGHAQFEGGLHANPVF
uniref:GEgh 16 protein n=1 Tax=Mycena chlorophos TaxID=658473 RepID=A0ABQ0KUJ5_MYCCL|nr:predicted protein [Mycena chlorophos]